MSERGPDVVGFAISPSSAGFIVKVPKIKKKLKKGDSVKKFRNSVTVTNEVDLIIGC